MPKQHKDFNFLGEPFQIRLIKQIVEDKKFGESIIDILDPNYFGDEPLKYIVLIIKSAFSEYNIIPDYEGISMRINSNTSLHEIKLEQYTQKLQKIQEVDSYDAFEVEKLAMKFCKSQELRRAIDEIKKHIEKDDNYEECETILRKALDIGDNKDDTINIFDNIEQVLSPDYRNPIPTGIKVLDEAMDGGLSKGELGIILAPYGTGKTTMITKIANTAASMGKKVIQIFFEDKVDQIQRKHLACWSNINANELPLHKEKINEIVNGYKKTAQDNLLLKRFPSDGTTMSTIKKYIRKKIAQGFHPDMILLDYIDVVEPSKKWDDINVGEGKLMREFETMLGEYNIAGWTAVQGNRSSINSEIVDGKQMGGSIKKAQIGHFILSIARTIEMQDANTANITILKSRFSKSGLVFNDVYFDNGKVQIVFENKATVTRKEFTEKQSEDSQNYLSQFFGKNGTKKQEAKEARNNVLNNNNN
jgi:replicative DNA helicase